MGNFGRDSGSKGGYRGGDSRGRSSFGNRGGFNRRDDRGPRKMYKTVCSNCGRDCEVPFQPTSGKPVYCSDCFEKFGGRDSGRDDRSRPSENRYEDRRPQSSSPSGSDQLKSQIDLLNAKLDKVLSLLQPKPVQEPAMPIEEVKPKAEKVTKKKTSTKKQTTLAS